ncbi:Right handed beta helix region [Candidatus Burarchaeum australiense]|nr:Right handed beta helix region [Candidatus Burarchaeum australiense]
MRPPIRIVLLAFVALLSLAPLSQAVNFFYNDSYPIVSTNGITNIDLLNLTFAADSKCYLLTSTADATGTVSVIINSTFAIGNLIDRPLNSSVRIAHEIAGSQELAAAAKVACFGAATTSTQIAFNSMTAGTAVSEGHGRLTALELTSANYLWNFTIASNIAAAWTYLANVTFTVPAGGGNYTIIAVGSTNASTASTRHVIRLDIDGVEVAMENATNNVASTGTSFFAHLTPTLAAGSHSARVSAFCGTINRCSVGNLSVIVVNLTGMSLVHMTNNTAGPLINSLDNTFTDVVNLTFVPLAPTTYFLIASAILNSTSTTSSDNFEAALVIDGEIGKTQNNLTFQANVVPDLQSFGVAGNFTFTGGVTHTVQIMFRSPSKDTAWIDNASITLIAVKSECGTLVANTFLTEDITSTGTCYTIGADSITLDCNGHTLTGAGTGNGVFNNGYDNVVIKNCIINSFAKGIYFQSGSNSAIFLNNTFNNNVDGIYVDHSDLTSAWNNTIASATNTGITLNVSQWSAVVNTTVRAARSRAIQLYQVNNSFVYNATLGTNLFIPATGIAGINVEECNGTTIANISLSSMSTGIGINITLSNATRIENSSIDNLFVYGIQMVRSNNSFVYNSSLTNMSFDFPPTSTPGAGISLSGSYFNLFQNLTIWNNSGSGMSFSSSDNNSVENTSFRRNGLASATYSINLVNSNNNTFWNTTSEDQLSNPDSCGVLLNGGTNDNRFLNFTARNNSRGFMFTSAGRNLFVNASALNNTYGVYIIKSSSDNYFINSTFVTSGVASVFVTAAGAPASVATNNTFLNCTFGVYNVSLPSSPGGTNYIRVQWYSRIRVLDYGGAGLTGAFFNVSNVSALIATDLATGNQIINLTDGAIGDGYSNWTIVEEGVIRSNILGSQVFFTENNHTFNASATGYATNWTNVTVNESVATVVYLPSAAVDVSFTLTLPGQAVINASNYTPPLNVNYTADIEFNITNKSMWGVNASVAPCCANQQTAATPIFQYTNTGGAAINISLWFNGTTMPPGVNVTASNGTGSYNTGDCKLGAFADRDMTPDGDPGTTCKNVTTTASRFISDLQPGQSRNLFLWATFDNFPATPGSVGTGDYTRNVTHSSENAAP